MLFWESLLESSESLDTSTKRQGEEVKTIQLNKCNSHLSRRAGEHSSLQRCCRRGPELGQIFSAREIFLFKINSNSFFPYELKKKGIERWAYCLLILQLQWNAKCNRSWYKSKCKMFVSDHDQGSSNLPSKLIEVSQCNFIYTIVL